MFRDYYTMRDGASLCIFAIVNVNLCITQRLMYQICEGNSEGKFGGNFGFCSALSSLVFIHREIVFRVHLLYKRHLFGLCRKDILRFQSCCRPILMNGKSLQKLPEMALWHGWGINWANQGPHNHCIHKVIKELKRRRACACICGRMRVVGRVWHSEELLRWLKATLVRWPGSRHHYLQSFNVSLILGLRYKPFIAATWPQNASRQVSRWITAGCVDGQLGATLETCLVLNGNVFCCWNDCVCGKVPNLSCCNSVTEREVDFVLSPFVFHSPSLMFHVALGQERILGWF